MRHGFGTPSGENKENVRQGQGMLFQISNNV